MITIISIVKTFVNESCDLL